MFNLSTSSTVGYNGICQLRDTTSPQSLGWGARLPRAPSLPHKPHNTTKPKQGKLSGGVVGGRGPALHEALQRISVGAPPTPAAPSAPTLPRGWCAPGTPLFDCGAMEAGAYWSPEGPAPPPDAHTTAPCTEWSLQECGESVRSVRLSARLASVRRRAAQLRLAAAHLPRACSPRHAHALQRAMQLQSDAPLREVAGTGAGKSPEHNNHRCGERVMGVGECAVGCGAPALVCARLCLAHITACPSQRLYCECTAKFSDNSPCRRPVLPLGAPLCPEHQWKRDNYSKLSLELKPKKAPRKRPKPSAMIRPQKRSRRRKKPPNHTLQIHTEVAVCSSSSAGSSSEDVLPQVSPPGPPSPPPSPPQHNNTPLEQESAGGVLVLPELPMSLPPLRDFSIFKDLLVEPNGAYTPTAEETEELERALEEVNRDVKSLEKLASGGSGGGSPPLLLDALLDDRELDIIMTSHSHNQ